MIYDFQERLSMSQGQRGEKDSELLKRIIPNCIDVRKTNEELDRKGIDYIAILQDGAEIGIDVKARDKGISKYWKNGQEDLLLEIWSVYPEDGIKGIPGWTLSEKTNVDFILYTFDETDSKNYYLLPYQLLRMAFRHNGHKWINEYGRKFTSSEAWRTQFVCVPADVVINAIKAEMYGNVEGADNI